MGQVPNHAQFCLVGNGRLARHFAHYCKLLAIPFSFWHRQMDVAFEERLGICPRVLLLISDSAIEDFIQQYSCLKGRLLIHCSGALSTSLAHGVHPLCTFAHDLYTLETYRSIALVVDSDAPALSTLLPGFDNPHYALGKENKAFYHALCVLGGNFTGMLWKKVFAEMAKLGIPLEAVTPYLEQTCTNLVNNPLGALTGPLARGDDDTIHSNIKALASDPYGEVYSSFVTAYNSTETAL